MNFPIMDILLQLHHLVIIIMALQLATTQTRLIAWYQPKHDFRILLDIQTTQEHILTQSQLAQLAAINHMKIVNRILSFIGSVEKISSFGGIGIQQCTVVCSHGYYHLQCYLLLCRDCA